MKWKEIKEAIESQGVTDDSKVDNINIVHSPNYIIVHFYDDGHARVTSRS